MSSAFTLLELLAVITILSVLAAFLVPNFGRIRENAEKAKCLGNMRSLQVALASYLNDNDRWPQCPVDPRQEKAYGEWWVKELQPYGVGPSTWQCPTIRRKVLEAGFPASEIPPIHYAPTKFDAHPSTPRKWPTQPWLIEIGNPHPGGALIAFPDGSIRGFDQVMASMGVR